MTSSRILGDEAIQSIVILGNFAEQLEKSGYVQRTDDGIRLTPKGFRQIGQNALSEIFKNLKKDQLGFHAQSQKGTSATNPEDTLEVRVRQALQCAHHQHPEERDSGRTERTQSELPAPQSRGRCASRRTSRSTRRTTKARRPPC